MNKAQIKSSYIYCDWWFCLLLLEWSSCGNTGENSCPRVPSSPWWLTFPSTCIVMKTSFEHHLCFMSFVFSPLTMKEKMLAVNLSIKTSIKAFHEIHGGSNLQLPFWRSRIYWYFLSEHKNEKKINLKYNLLENWKSDLKDQLAGNILGFLSYFILSLIKGLPL